MPSSSPGKGPRDVESQNPKKKPSRASAAAGSPLTKYFLVILVGASTLSLAVNNKFADSVHLHEGSNVVHSALKNFRVSDMHKAYLEHLPKVQAIGDITATDPPDDDGDDDGDDDNNNSANESANENNDDNSNNNDDGDSELHDPLMSEKEKFGMMDEEEDDDGNGEDADADDTNADDTNANNDGQQVHKIANLNCEAYGGPSNEDAEEMVYWEDIPKDALHLSPFHAEHPQNSNNNNNNKKSIAQFLTFEPDAGGWNNIRMAMGT